MKKLIFILIAFVFSFAISAQERTVDLNSGKLFDITEYKNIAYNGTTSDRLIPTTRDTIDYYIRIKDYDQGNPLHFYVAFNFDTIAGIDTTVAITVQGKMFANQDYSDIIASSVTAGVIRADTIAVRTSLGTVSEYTETYTFATSTDTLLYDTTAITYALDTYGGDSVAFYKATIENVAHTATVTKVTGTSLYYRYLKFRLILQGNDAVGTGIKVKRVELQFL